LVKLSVGVEYYTDLGPLQNWLPFNEQQHNIYAVVDFNMLPSSSFSASALPSGLMILRPVACRPAG
jgi:hypothetical protein